MPKPVYARRAQRQEAAQQMQERAAVEARAVKRAKRKADHAEPTAAAVEPQRDED